MAASQQGPHGRPPTIDSLCLNAAPGRSEALRRGLAGSGFSRRQIQHFACCQVQRSPRNAPASAYAAREERHWPIQIKATHAPCRKYDYMDARSHSQSGSKLRPRTDMQRKPGRRQAGDRRQRNQITPVRATLLRTCRSGREQRISLAAGWQLSPDRVRCRRQILRLDPFGPDCLALVILLMVRASRQRFSRTGPSAAGVRSTTRARKTPRRSRLQRRGGAFAFTSLADIRTISTSPHLLRTRGTTTSRSVA